MTRTLVAAGLMIFTGSALLLSELRWFRRPSMGDRLLPYAPGAVRSTTAGVLSVASFREVVAPLARLTGERIARLFGVSEELTVRLRRIHSPLDATSFRVRQLAWAGAAVAGGTAIAVALTLSAPLAMLLVFGSPLLAFLLLEQQVAEASRAWQERLLLELPVVAEQLAMLTSAGWSLGAALHRISARGSGNCSADLRRVAQRMQQGLSEQAALREWGELADVDALDRLISVLAMNRETADLSRLISDEARSMRQESQRNLIETIERRNQQVWVPVTVAALIPGVVLMAVPFLDALSLFGSP
ncbi:MAG: type II secretion system F family protein [Acidimicrobiales bacterium]